jgi:hypothetical protein
MKSIANQYRDLTEGKMSQANFMRNLRMTMPQYVTNVTSFGDAVKILKNKSIIVESAIKENFDFNKAAIESATGDKISHTEEDDFGETIYWSTKNPNVTYYIGSDEQIIKYDGETGERYIIGDLRNYDEPSNDDYEPDTDADYEEPRDDFDMAGDYNDGEFWEGQGEGDEDAMYDEMIKKIEDELAAREAANAQYDLDEELNEAVGNFELKKLARELYSVAKRVNGVTSVKIVTSDVKNAASAFQAASKKGNTYAEDAVMVELFVNEADSFISIILSGSARFLNPVAGEVNKQIQDFINKNYANQLETQYVKPPKDNTMLGINIRFINKPSDDVKESEELNEAKKPNVERAEDENIEEVTLGIFMEHACFPDKSYEEIEKIVKKNIKRNPNYYTNYKLTGIRDYELETMDSSKPEDHQMKFYTEKTAVDTARGMQKIKMPKKEEKKKLKEARFNVIGEPNEVAKQVMQFVDGNATLKALSDDIQIQQTSDPNEALLRFQYWDALPGEAIEKLKLQFNVQPDNDFDEDTGEIIFYRLTPLRRDYGNKDLGASFEKMKKELEEIVNEVINEYYDGRDNLIDPLAAEENN